MHLSSRRSIRHYSEMSVLNLIGAGVAVSLLADVTLNVVLPTHTDEAGIVLANVGLMLSANRIIRIFINGPYGVLIERVPRRRILVPSLFLATVVTLLYTLPGFWPLLIGRLLWGTAWAGIWIGSNTVVLDLARFENRGRLVGRFQMWFPIGIGGSSLLGGWLTDTVGYESTFRIESLIMLLMALIWWWFLPETRPEKPPVETVTTASPTPQSTGHSKRLYTLPVILAVVLMALNWLLMIGGLVQLLPVLLERQLGEMIPVLNWVIPASTLTGMLIALNQVLGSATSPISGWFTDRTGNRWGLVAIATVSAVFALAFGATGIGLQLIVASMLAALTSSIYHTQLITIVGDHAPAGQQGRLLGILNTAGDLGGALGPLLVFALLPLIDTSGVLTLGLLPLLLILPVVLSTALRELGTR